MFNRFRSHQTLTSAFAYALVGVVLSLALHAHYVATWHRYVESISDARVAQRGGVPPAPHIAGTKTSARKGAAVFLISAVIVALVARRYWIACAAFAAGVATSTLLLAVVSGQLRGNLAPIGAVLILALILVPIAVGTAIGGGLRMMVGKRNHLDGAGTLLFVLMLSTLGGCASSPAPSQLPTAQTTAELSLVRLNPASATTLTRTSIIEGTFNYRISNMDPKATYTLEPGFGDRRGPGYTFNAVTGPADVVTLTTPGGTVEMRYPVLREWANQRLARPIEISFDLIERKPSGGRVLATVGPYRYEAASETP